jgi:hypothetical protein
LVSLHAYIEIHGQQNITIDIDINIITMKVVCYPETLVLLCESQILNNCSVIQSILLPNCVEVTSRKMYTFYCNYRGVMSSMVCICSVTARGEPPLCMSCTVLFALRNALDSAHKEPGKPDKWYQIGMLISLML